MKRLLGAVFTSSLLWGGLASFGFYAALHRGYIDNPLILRYAAGHPVEYITVAMFFVGMTRLAFHAMGLLQQHRGMALGTVFEPIRPEKEEASRAEEYLEAIERAVQFRGDSYHLGRLKKALLFLKSSGRAEELDQELRCLADEEAIRAESAYGMVRMFIWAIPILGFLGTVIGITVALGNLDLTELETSGELLASGLKVAFDTTALALSLVFVLYFSLFIVQRSEGKLFAAVDALVDAELKGRFYSVPGIKEQEEFRAIRRVLKTVTESYESMMRSQSLRWDEAMGAVAQRAGEILLKGAEQINHTLRQSLQESAAGHARMMIAGEEKLLTETLTPFVRTMKENAERVAGLQNELVSQGKLFRDILATTGEVTLLEDRLNHNLRSLSEASCFAETVNSLAATIHLLNGKLGGAGFTTDRVGRTVSSVSESFAASIPSEAPHRSNSLRSVSSEESEEDAATLRMPEERRGGLFSRKGRRDKSA